MSFSKRLHQAKDYFGYNPNTLSKAMGLEHNALVYKYLDISKNAQPTLKTISMIRKAMPGINLNWLLEGEGSMLVEKAEADYKSLSAAINLLNEIKPMISDQQYENLLKAFVFAYEGQ